MKAFFRWLVKIVGSAISIVLVIIFFPYISRYASMLMPDENGAAIKASAVIASRLESSARLETLRVEEEGVMNYDIQAAFVGSVANISVRYNYQASFGIDLAHVEIVVQGNEVTFLLPEPELIQDSITPVETYRDDFWYPGFSDDDYAALLEKERLSRRTDYLTGAHSAELCVKSQEAFEKTISDWMKEIDSNVQLRYEINTEKIQ